MDKQILDAEFPLPEYLGECLTESEIKAFLAGEYDSISSSDINDHINLCVGCRNLAEEIIIRINLEHFSK